MHVSNSQQLRVCPVNSSAAWIKLLQGKPAIWKTKRERKGRNVPNNKATEPWKSVNELSYGGCGTHAVC